MPEKITVIGAGIAGLAAAIRLSAKGFDVDVYEKNSNPGGKMSEFTESGFRFDTGPSLFTMPAMIEELFKLAGEDITGYFGYKRLNNTCRYFFNNGKIIDGYQDVEAFIAELVGKAGEDGENVRAYLKHSRDIYNATSPVFIMSSLHILKNYFRKDFLKAFLFLPRLNAFQTMNGYNSRHFRSKEAIQIFNRFATYNGSNPFKAPATLMVIPHLEHNIGAFFPDKGIYQVATALEQLAIKQGVRFFYDAEVTRIYTENNKVAGIEVLGRKIASDYIVTDTDIYFLYKNLLRDVQFPKRWFRHERSTSAMIFYWGMKLQSKSPDLHNILFSGDYKEEFRHLFELKEIYHDPTIYIFISSKVVTEDAPRNCENWFVMINVPENTGQAWDALIEEVREHIKGKILRVLGIRVDDHILFEKFMDPASIESRTASYRGSLYGNSSNSVFAAFNRHPNFSRRIRGLYCAGGSVHPGGGIPLCLASAKIVADLVGR